MILDLPHLEGEVGVEGAPGHMLPVEQTAASRYYDKWEALIG